MDGNPNLYTTELINMKQEKILDLGLEEVLNKKLIGPMVEDRVIELRLTLEDDQAQRREDKEEECELKETEILQLICYISEVQREFREGYGETMGVLVVQVNDIREALSLFNWYMANQLKSLNKQVVELGTQIMIQLSELRNRLVKTTPTDMGRIIPDSTESTIEEAAETLARADRAERVEKGAKGTNIVILEKPSRDSFVVDNSPICNLGAFGAPLKYAKYRDGSTSSEPSPASSPVKSNKPVNSRGVSNQPEDEHGEPPAPKALKKDLGTQMANNKQACQPGMNASIHTGIAPKAS
ncbi:hypothetical protein L211DRAFT_849792 [Terfezia boudieri ATCC MYA-4762]|uniref:Uncharacterized protein n=1 Tax=Terfezia boudieri ATCC MYA-4762 TaxID=1051890 RepID=A0A3N4LL44_9PEZI|nr:hypothetical protein L211DRAFT_849792 [Terfezia boudieri ATCC MYA-4762]